jgi:hypothetical protein
MVGCSLEADPAGRASQAMTGKDECVPDKDTECDEGCTLTQGFWKNHPDAWPVSSLTLGSVSYSQAQLLSILETPVKGNGLVQLAHQLIAAKLNVASGASGSSIAGSIVSADTLIGALIVPPVGDGSLSTEDTSSLNDALDAFNEGATGPGHCEDEEERCTDEKCPVENETCTDEKCPVENEEEEECTGDKCPVENDGDEACTDGKCAEENEEEEECTGDKCPVENEEEECTDEEEKEEDEKAR